MTESKISEFLKKGDLFSQDIEILFQSGSRKLKSQCGTLLGIIMLSIIVFYAVLKIQIMVNYEQNIVLEPKKVDYFSSDH